MSAEEQKAQAFISRLLSNPALQGYTPLQMEEQIIQFLHANGAQLAPTLASPAFFSGKSWNQIVALLLGSLMKQIDAALIPSIQKIVDERIGFTFLSHLRNQAAGADQVKTQVATFVTGLLQKPDARRAFTGAHTALHYRFLDRYMEAFWARHSYIHFELTKVQRLRMSKEEIKSMIETTLLLKPVVFMMTTATGGLPTEQTATIVQNQFAEKVFTAAQKQLNLLPDQVIKSAVNASISFLENRFIEATSRIAAVLAARCRDFQPNVQVDRGADTPDKSWFSIARRNYKFYGFDIKMLDEFYQIAAEHGW